MRGRESRMKVGMRKRAESGLLKSPRVVHWAPKKMPLVEETQVDGG
jgi:hypothetical protein